MSSMKIENKLESSKTSRARKEAGCGKFAAVAQRTTSPLPYGRGSSGTRRGNSIILVTALLVLLVIIATAYVTRTTAGRVTARAIRFAEARDASAQIISEMLAQVPADALFVQPVSPAYRDPNNVADSNAPRLPSRATESAYGTLAFRYNADFNSNGADLNGDGFPDASLPYNFAPMHVVPFTNWPDPLSLSLIPTSWPAGPGNPSGGTAGALNHEGNPLGNPGFGDARWLADFEPIRIDVNGDGILESFSHCRHISYLGRSDNGWRVCRDIQDITDVDADGWGGIVEDLNIPIEQWLAAPNTLVSTANSDTEFTLAAWNNWVFRSFSLQNYQTNYTDPVNTPGNFYRLRNLDADNSSGEPGETPNDEFVLGSARNFVSRYLADTDGDGYTDAFWHLAPLPVKDGVRHVVAVRIIPNNAMIDVNTATRFQPIDNVILAQGGATGPNARTRGHTPADIALVSACAPDASFANSNVGFYDDPLNDAGGSAPFDYFVPRWLDHVAFTGMPNGFSGPGTLNQYQRLDYWRRAGLNPLTASSISTYQPFTLADEIELRMFSGQNYEYIFSRYEHSVQSLSAGTGEAFLRAGQGMPETTEIGDQLLNQELVLDQRHRITTYSATRNEELAPWLRYRWAEDTRNVFGAVVPGGDGIADYVTLPRAVQKDIDDQVAASGAASQQELENIHRDISERFLAQNRLKLDLREPSIVYNPAVSDFEPLFPVTFPGNAPVYPGSLSLRERLPIALYHALDDGPRFVGGSLVGTTYLGTYSENIALGGPGTLPESSRLVRIRKAATSLAANMLSYRDADDLIHLNDDPDTEDVVEGPLPLPELPGVPADEDTRYLGMERQPFLTEVFIAHAYEVLTVPDEDIDGDPYLPPDERVVLHNGSRHSTIVVVQIANPFDRQIDLRQYKISVFGNINDEHTTSPTPIWLQPSTPETPNTAIFYAMKDDIGTTSGQAFRLKWMDFLDIETADLTPNTIVRRVVSDWPTERDDYDGAATTVDAVQLIRSVEDPPGSGLFVDVVIDRMDQGEGGDDNRDFAQAVKGLESNKPPDQLNDPANTYDVPPLGAPYQGYPTWALELPFDHWVQWVRCSRAWGVDLDGDDIYQQDERNPRFVFSDRVIVESAASTPSSPDYPLPDTSYGLNANGHGGNKYTFASDPDDNGTGTGASPPPIPWFRRDYVSMYPLNRTATAPPYDPEIRTGKPTFFDMKRDGLAVYNGIPDKGWYGQRAGSSTFSVDDPTIDSSNGDRFSRQNFSMQMIQKDGDFEQIGEVLNVWIMGHELDMTCPGSGLPCTYNQTNKTFSEYMSEWMTEAPPFPQYGQRARVNRLGAGEATLGVAIPADLVNPLHSVPDQPATVRVMDLFVCDGYGINSFDLNGNGTIEPNEHAEAEARRFSNANGFSGQPVFGMPNANVAPPEVLRAMPQWSRMVYESPGRTSRTYIAEAVTQYRDRYDGDPSKAYGYRNMIDTNGDGIMDPSPNQIGPNYGPDYSDRDALWPGINNVRTERGLASIGEILMMTKPADAPDPIDQNRWSAEFAGMNPFQRSTAPDLTRLTTRLSTDTNEDRSYNSPINAYWDRVASDAEELNMLFSGVSNMVTTRSDTFTIYFRIRSFKQNPTSGRWDATDPEYIVDDSRYVMLVDRSNVNKPGDKPKILFLEKCPN